MMTAEDLEAESKRLAAKFEDRFGDVVRDFFKDMRVFADKVTKAEDVSDVLKEAVLTSLIKRLSMVDQMIERIGDEEGIA